MRYCCPNASPISKEGYGWLCERCGTLLDEAGLEPRHKGAPLIKAPILEIGRNEPCRCGSGKKFKRCCGRLIDKLKAEGRQAAVARIRSAANADSRQEESHTKVAEVAK